MVYWKWFCSGSESLRHKENASARFQCARLFSFCFINKRFSLLLNAFNSFIFDH